VTDDGQQPPGLRLDREAIDSVRAAEERCQLQFDFGFRAGF
jgi:hypothetical protein